MLITASSHKTFVRQGLKEVQKHIRRGEKGYLFIHSSFSVII